VTAAKLLVCAVTCATYAPALYLLRGSTHAGFILATVVYMVGFAMDVSWYFRALERMRSLLVVTLLTRLSGLALLWTIVTQPGDMVQALWSYAFVAIANATIGWAVVVQQGLAGHAKPQWSVITPLMRDASAIVIGNLSGALLTNGGVALLGMTANPATVGAANLALRIKMAGQALLLPIKQLSYVRLSALASSDRRRALRIGRIVLGAMLAGGSVIGIAIALSAEWIVHQVFSRRASDRRGARHGARFERPDQLGGRPCSACNALIAFGRERSYAVVVLVAAMVFLRLAGRAARRTRVRLGVAHRGGEHGSARRVAAQHSASKNRMNEMRTTAGGDADRPTMPWWTSPAGISMGFLMPILFLIAYVGEANLPGVTIRGVRFLSMAYIAMGALLIGVIAVAGWIGQQIRSSAREAADVRHWDAAASVVGAVALLAYFFWFRDFLPEPGTLAANADRFISTRPLQHRAHTGTDIARQLRPRRSSRSTPTVSSSAARRSRAPHMPCARSSCR